MRKFSFHKLIIPFSLILFSNVLSSALHAQDSYTELSADFLFNIKEGKKVESYISKLANADEKNLEEALNSREKKKAFWINIYNAYIQYELKKNPRLYNDRSEFFSEKKIKIAGALLSFDDIEHGILRGSSWKYSLGYLKNPFVSNFEERFRLEETDKRIHFALNCGAKSCPPIAIYTAINFNEKINEVARSYLKQCSKFNKEENSLYTTSLFSWFRGDFGGSSGIRNTLIEYKVLPKDSDASINYQPYDWTLDLDNYYD